MVLVILLSGMFVSIMIDWYCYRAVKNGIVVESYPTYYLKYNAYQLVRSWVLWATIWPIIFGMTVINYILKKVKK